MVMIDNKLHSTNLAVKVVGYSVFSYFELRMFFVNISFAYRTFFHFFILYLYVCARVKRLFITLKKQKNVLSLY